ncbi:unnamed protein product, partial [Schistosoma haematobium]
QRTHYAEKCRQIDMRGMTKNWIELERKAEDRVGWRMLFDSLCLIGSNRR